MSRLPASQTAAAALNEVFLRLGFAGILSDRYVLMRSSSVVGVASLLVSICWFILFLD